MPAHLGRNAAGYLEGTDHTLEGSGVHLDLAGSFEPSYLDVDLLKLAFAVLLLQLGHGGVNNSEVKISLHVGNKHLDQWA